MMKQNYTKPLAEEKPFEGSDIWDNLVVPLSDEPDIGTGVGSDPDFE